ncbi:MAG: hypothetical protein WED04_10820 [Promethearchaeati archaeon SRVP18_Atabeyarchaeia-1]
MLKGLRVIWQSVSKFHIVLFALLCVTSLLLLTDLPWISKPLIISALVGGTIYFLGLAFLALVPPLWRALAYILRFSGVKLALFAATFLFTYLFLYPSFILIEVIVAIGSLAWLVNLSIMACVLPYSMSTRLSHHSPRPLGWFFFICMGLVNAVVYLGISRIPILQPFLYAYVLGWLTPCVLISLAKYRDRRVFAGYMLVALFYSLYPVAYRLYSLSSQVFVLQGGSVSLPSSLPIEEALTVLMFCWALNTVGRLANSEYKLFKEGKEKLENKLTSPLRILRREKGKDEQQEAYAVAATLFEEFKKEELAVNPVFVFGLLFSALAYFVFKHGYTMVNVPGYIEPGVALVLSLAATVPLLFYMMIKKR